MLANRCTVRRCRIGVLLTAAIAAFAPATATAHFVLQGPACWMSQDSLGLPEKMGPCGDEGGGTPTGVVTAFQSGQTITITINEVIFHPGHYRIALAVNGRNELPAEPTVTPDSMSPCGSVPIQNPPVFPVLADGVLAHTAPFNGPQTVQVTLPANITCTKCTLQIIEFMSQHPLNNPGGCFYHHCADISLQTVVPDGGGQQVNGDGGARGATPAAGSSCSIAARVSKVPAVGLLAIVALLWSRRRRSHRMVK